MWSLGSAEVVWDLGYQLEKSDEVVAAVFDGDHSKWWTTKFEWYTRNSIPAAERPTSRPATESWHCWQGDRWTKLRKNTSVGLMRTTLKLIQQPNRCGQSQSSMEWYCPSFRCEWSDISVTVHWSGLISVRRGVLSYRGPRFHFPKGMFSEVDVRSASIFLALCCHHVDPPELLHLAVSSPMHGRNVALVAAMNTPTTFCNVNYVQKNGVLNIMTDELSINGIKSAVT